MVEMRLLARFIVTCALGLAVEMDLFNYHQHWWEGQMVVQRLLKCGKTILKEY